jgi:hypothetical protein
MSLRWLIEHQKAWNGPAPSLEELVQAEMNRDVVAYPIFTAAHLRKRKRTFICVRNIGLFPCSRPSWVAYEVRSLPTRFKAVARRLFSRVVF